MAAARSAKWWAAVGILCFACGGVTASRAQGVDLGRELMELRTEREEMGRALAAGHPALADLDLRIEAVRREMGKQAMGVGGEASAGGAAAGTAAGSGQAGVGNGGEAKVSVPVVERWIGPEDYGGVLELGGVIRADGSDELADLLASSIAPETWKRNGGEVGELRGDGGGGLRVVQSVEGQRAVDALLKEMERAMKERHVAARVETVVRGPGGAVGGVGGAVLSQADREMAGRMGSAVGAFAMRGEVEQMVMELAKTGGAGGVDLEVNWKALEAIGISRHALVSVRFGGGSVWDAIRAVFAAAAGADGKYGWIVLDGRVVVSTHDDLLSAKYQVVRVYDVRDLLDQARAATLPGVNRDVLAQALISEITRRIDPESWRDNGGTVGSIRELNGQLIVSQTIWNHAALEEFLAGLWGDVELPARRVEVFDPKDEADQLLDTDADRALRDKLETNLKEITVEAQGFEKVIHALRDSMSMNIEVNWKALETVGIDRNTPVTISLREVPFRTALATILSQVGGGTASVRFIVDRGELVISTRDDLESERYCRVVVYNVRDLVYPAKFEGFAPGVVEAVHDQAATMLMTTITSMVVPDTWRDSGGIIGSIREYHGLLVVHQTVENQHEVGGLIAELRGG